MCSLLHFFARSMSTRVRFAPSPTGNLHLGGLRTALYNYLFAKKHEGTFVLRLEDTDQSRLVPGSAAEIEQILNWSGLFPDESPIQGGPYGPYVQSERINLYTMYANELLESGAAYRCFCSEKRLLLMKKDANRSKRPSKYDRRCLHLSKQEIQDKLGEGHPFTIRFKIRPFREGYHDLIFGHTSHDIFEFEGDPIIMKSDGYPTYHFANVIDDHLMKISHVFRGVEWQVSTPKHIMLYEAFGWKPPKFAHLPLIMNADGTKLSKRQKDIHVNYYQENGYFSEAILNFMSTVGGGFDFRDHSCEEVYALSDLIQKFNPSRISTFSGRIERDKLDTLNRFCIKSKFNNDRKTFISHLTDLYPELKTMSEEKITRLMNWSWNRIHTLQDLSSNKGVSLLWFPLKDVPKLSSQDIIILKQIKDIFEGKHSELSYELKSLAKNNGIKYPQIMQLIRFSLYGDKQGPPIKDILDIMGSEAVIDRINEVISFNE